MNIDTSTLEQQRKELQEYYQPKINLSYVLWVASIILLITGGIMMPESEEGVRYWIGGSISVFSLILWFYSFSLWRNSKNPITEVNRQIRQLQQAQTQAAKEAQAALIYQQQIEAWNKLTPEQQNMLTYQALHQKKTRTSGFVAFGDDPLTLAATGIASWFLIDKLANKD